MLLLIVLYIAIIQQFFVKAASPPNQIAYTLYQLPLQANFIKNQARIKGTAYEPYFRPDLFIYPEMIKPGRTPIDCTSGAMSGNFSDINTLLAPASVQLKNEDAWCSYPDGQGFVSSRSHWPGVTAEMASWWMWWHSGQSERYSLWHPWAHISVSSTYSEHFDDPKYSDTQKLVGSIHHVREIIGELNQNIEIHWKRPNYFGLDESKFDENGIVASACGEIYIAGPLLKAVDMVHLWYKTEGGLELRSRYFMGNHLRTPVPLIDKLPIEKIASWFHLKKFMVGPKLSLLQFHHDQQVS